MRKIFLNLNKKFIELEYVYFVFVCKLFYIYINNIFSSFCSIVRSEVFNFKFYEIFNN